VPHLSDAGVTARVTDPARHTRGQAKAAALQDELIEEFLGADGYLFTVPMYNLSIPSSFRAWLDQILVADRIVSHSGPPVAGRPAVLLSAWGGGYSPRTSKEGLDYRVPTLEALLGRDDLLGLDVTTVIPELTMAPVTPAFASLLPLHEESLTAAHAQVRDLATALSNPRAA
jgi:FMN-dependent NADH-azoreductase